MTCNNCMHGELCMGRTDTTPFTKTEYRDLYNVEKFCEDFKNKADFVEVVRCKDCKYFKKGLCIKTNGMVSNNPFNFCSYGERKLTKISHNSLCETETHESR